MDSPTSPPRPQRNRWFVFNVVALCILAPWATYWFQEHLQLYFTEIVVIGGAISLWVLLRGMWAVLEKAGKVDVWEHSRKLLSLPDITGLLAVGIVVFQLLWFHTASLYIQFHGAPGEGDYVVEVVRTADNSPFIARTHLNAEHAVIGTPVLWQRDPVDWRGLRSQGIAWYFAGSRMRHCNATGSRCHSTGVPITACSALTWVRAMKGLLSAVRTTSTT